jgi:hypothetical protein
MVTRATLYDPYLVVTASWPTNPSEGGEPSRRKSLSIIETTASDGRTIVFEGTPPPLEFEFRLTVLSLTERDFWVEWFSKPYQVQYTSDLGEQYWIYFDRLDMSRKRAINRPFKADMTAHAYELDIP